MREIQINELPDEFFGTSEQWYMCEACDWSGPEEKLKGTGNGREGELNEGKCPDCGGETIPL